MSSQHIVDVIKYRMKSLGIDLEKYIKKELNTWGNGFNFIPHDWKVFAWALRNSGRFCIVSSDSLFGSIDTRKQKGVPSWREDAKDSSMHVLYRKGEPFRGYGEVVGYYEIHIDSVSVVAGQDPCGKCLYNSAGSLLGSLTTHVSADLLHLPFFVPDEGKGPYQIGIRF